LKTALIIGSTGLIGSQLLELLLESENYDHVISFVKRETNLHHPKLTQHRIDFDKPQTYQDLVKGDDFFCTIGTTIKSAGSKKGFRKVDFDYPCQFAKLAKENNIKQFLIVSSLGADSKSSNFYLKTKGEIEAFLKTCDFDHTAILRPSILLGNRAEFRLGEKIGTTIMKFFSILLIGNWKKYKPIRSKTVAEALFSIAQNKEKGFRIYESDAIERQ